MILSRRVSLNGAQLDELDDRILISGTDEAAGKENITAVSSAAGNGQRITARRRDTLDVTVKFTINIEDDTAEGMSQRETLLETINAWARAGGKLRMGHKPGRRLNVVLAQAPGTGDPFNWTNEYTMVFRAYDSPYWEDDDQNSMRIGSESSEASGEFTLGGSAEADIEVQMRNASGKMIKKLSVKVGGRKMEFDEIDLDANETLIIDHTARGLVRIRIKNGDDYRSALALRTGADDFKAEPGTVKVSFSAQRAVRTTVYWRCRYL